MQEVCGLALKDKNVAAISEHRCGRGKIGAVVPTSSGFQSLCWLKIKSLAETPATAAWCIFFPARSYSGRTGLGVKGCKEADSAIEAPSIPVKPSVV